MFKLGIVINFHKDRWYGGYNHFITLIKYLRKFKKDIKIVIFTDNKKNLLTDSFFKKHLVIETNLVSNEKFLLRIFLKISIILFGKSNLLESFFLNKVDIVSHYLYLGKKSKIKSMPWFPDFQEIYYPKNFTLRARVFRRLKVLISAIHATAIIVSSKCAMNDLKKISNKAYKKSILIRHTADLPDTKSIISINKIKKKYNIDKNFFYLPNAYWVHKNHIVVLKALKFLKGNSNILIISSGQSSDPKSPNHFKKLLQYIKDEKLSKNYRYLGIIPRKDNLSLMYHTMAVINPSTFEGWSSTVEEAKVLCKRVILSNIPPHKEQKVENCYYFGLNDYKKLSKILNLLLHKNIIKGDLSKKNIKKIENIHKNNIQDYVAKLAAHIKK
jgi:glycosyltransferase involved in cell wall biosynthesis